MAGWMKCVCLFVWFVPQVTSIISTNVALWLSIERMELQMLNIKTFSSTSDIETVGEIASGDVTEQLV